MDNKIQFCMVAKPKMEAIDVYFGSNGARDYRIYSNMVDTGKILIFFLCKERFFGTICGSFKHVGEMFYKVTSAYFTNFGVALYYVTT